MATDTQPTSDQCNCMAYSGVHERAPGCREPQTKEEQTAINWPTSKGDPIKPVWSYGGKKGMSQAEALRAFAHDLVAIIKEFEMPLREAMKQAGGDGLSTWPYIKMLTKRINGLEAANIDLRASLAREENARKTLAETERRQAAEIARLADIIDRCAS